jgi:adenine phosphoribosyltransferase
MATHDDRQQLILAQIRDVPDFPKPGILFKDIAPIMESPAAFAAVISLFAERWRGAGLDRIAGLESRGFPFGAALAYELGVGFSMIRKKGKLPFTKVGVDYALEYGTDRIEAHVDTVLPGQKVLLVDDLLATGGTASAAIHLLRDHLKADVVGAAFVVELAFLGGASKLDVPIHSLVTY